jgi:hypothetical protein
MDGMMHRALLACLLLTGVPGQDSQTDDADARRRAAAEAALRAQQERAAAEADRRERERSIERMREFMRDGREDIRRAVERSEMMREAERSRKNEKFRNALKGFTTDSNDFREAMGLRPLKGPATSLEKHVRTLLDLVKEMTTRRAKLDTSEFKDITRSELEWEALTTAERMLPQLHAVISDDQASTVDVKVLNSLPQLELDLLRLQWMTRRLK